MILRPVFLTAVLHVLLNMSPTDCLAAPDPCIAKPSTLTSGLDEWRGPWLRVITPGRKQLKLVPRVWKSGASVQSSVGLRC